MSKFEIEKTLIASSAHILPDDIEAFRVYNDIFIVDEYDYGWTVYLHDSIIDDLGKVRVSEGIRMLILFSVFNGCKYLKVDSDGPTYKGFEEYEW